MNDLRERLDRLADGAADGIELARPDETRPAASRPWWRSGPALAVTAAVLVVAAAGTAMLLLGRDDGDNDVAVGDGREGSPGQGNDAVVAVTYGDASSAGGHVDLRLRFLDADGDVIAERSWAGAEPATEGQASLAVAIGGVVQRVPAGDLTLEAILGGTPPTRCSQPFTTAPGDRLILRLQFGATCATLQSVDDWVDGRTSATGEEYIGLTPADAADRAEAAGLTTRVVGVDGVDLVITADLRLDRLDLMLFDGRVVAASLPGDGARLPDPQDCSTTPSAPSTSWCRTVIVPSAPASSGDLECPAGFTCRTVVIPPAPDD